MKTRAKKEVIPENCNLRIAGQFCRTCEKSEWSSRDNKLRCKFLGRLVEDDLVCDAWKFDPKAKRN